jgi:hypothetical protein
MANSLKTPSKITRKIASMAKNVNTMLKGKKPKKAKRK